MAQSAEIIADNFRFTDAERRVFKARERIKVSAWAAAHRVVTTGPTIGKWDNSLTPYAVEPMDTFNLPWVRKIFLEWAPQTGKTSVALNCLCHCIAIDPGPALYVMPDEKVAKRIARRQLVPLFRNTPKIAELLGPRADDVTTLSVKFQNGMDLMMAWASSPAALASESIRYLFFDEPGKYPEWSGKEADPFSLGEQRQNRYENTSKQMYFSTPNLEGDAFDNLLATEPDEVRHYYARCPHCNTLQIMEFDSIHANGCKDHRLIRRKRLARYSCTSCKFDWDDHLRNRAVAAGRWKAAHPVERPVAVAFRGLASWYSQFVSLSTSLAAFFKSKEDPAKLQAFVTQHQCRAWAERVEKKEESELLQHKNDTPAGVVPDWAVALTCGIDTQKRGFWFVVRAWGEDLTSHLVQYGYLATFEDVENLVFNTTYPVAGNESDKKEIWRAAIDTGGGEGETEGDTRTEEVYAFITAMRYKYGERVLYGIKGASRRQFARVGPEKQIEAKPLAGGKRRAWRGIVTVRMLDTAQIKGLLYWRLGRKQSPSDENGEPMPAESQRFYLHAETGMDYARQFLAEELRRDRRGKTVWVQVRRDNHLLDAEVYAAAGADISWQPNLTSLAKFLEVKAAAPAKRDEKPAAAGGGWIGGSGGGSGWIGRR